MAIWWSRYEHGVRRCRRDFSSRNGEWRERLIDAQRAEYGKASGEAVADERSSLEVRTNDEFPR